MLLQEIQNNQFFTTYKETKNWLDLMKITDYKINSETLTVNVFSNVNLKGKNLKTIPVKFNYVTGIFDCSFNQLQTLAGSPRTAYQHFWCTHNQLTTLEGAPELVGFYFSCVYNKLTSLQGCPAYINEKLIFDCNLNTISNIAKFVKSVKFIILNNTQPNVTSFMWAFLIKNLTTIEVHNGSEEQYQVANIINNHLQGDRSGPLCQLELIDAGLGKYIKL